MANINNIHIYIRACVCSLRAAVMRSRGRKCRSRDLLCVQSIRAYLRRILSHWKWTFNSFCRMLVSISTHILIWQRGHFYSIQVCVWRLVPFIVAQTANSSPLLMVISYQSTTGTKGYKLAHPVGCVFYLNKPREVYIFVQVETNTCPWMSQDMCD